MYEYNGRDPKRIDPMLEKLSEAWKLYPDMRLGQLIGVCAESNNLFSMEDDELLKGIEIYIERMESERGKYGI